MSTLKQYTLNTAISPSDVKKAFITIAFNQEVNKGRAYEDYYCIGIVKVSTIKKGVCMMHMFNPESKTLYLDEKKFNLSSLPPTVIANTRRLPYRYVHVLFRKRLTYLSKQENKVIVKIGQPYFGYGSNEITVNPETLRIMTLSMNLFHEDKKVFWHTIPLPRYSAIRNLVKRSRLIQYLQSA